MSDKDASDKFWVVFGPMGNMPTKKHTTFESARLEAERLTRKHNGVSYVMESVGKVETIEPPIKYTELTYSKSDNIKPPLTSDPGGLQEAHEWDALV